MLARPMAGLVHVPHHVWRRPDRQKAECEAFQWEQFRPGTQSVGRRRSSLQGRDCDDNALQHCQVRREGGLRVQRLD